MNRLFLITSLLAFLASCNVTQPTGVALTAGIDSTIMLFDVKPSDSRLEIASFINKIDSMQPAVIGINIIFVGFKKAHEDSVLTQAIANSGKVILVAGMSDEGLLRSEYFLEDRALAIGVSKLLLDKEDRITHYIGFYEDENGRQELAFPEAVHFYYTRDHSINFPESRVNGIEPIVYSKKTDQFIVLNRKDLRLDQVKGKIVIFGSLTPEPEDPLTPLGQVEGENARTKSTIILANIILDLLKRYP